MSDEYVVCVSPCEQECTSSESTSCVSAGQSCASFNRSAILWADGHWKRAWQAWIVVSGQGGQGGHEERFDLESWNWQTGTSWRGTALQSAASWQRNKRYPYVPARSCSRPRQIHTCSYAHLVAGNTCYQIFCDLCTDKLRRRMGYVFLRVRAVMMSWYLWRVTSFVRDRIIGCTRASIRVVVRGKGRG